LSIKSVCADKPLPATAGRVDITGGATFVAWLVKQLMEQVQAFSNNLIKDPGE
jgi:hypothetical protein